MQKTFFASNRNLPMRYLRLKCLYLHMCNPPSANLKATFPIAECCLWHRCWRAFGMTFLMLHVVLLVWSRMRRWKRNWDWDGNGRSYTLQFNFVLFVAFVSIHVLYMLLDMHAESVLVLIIHKDCRFRALGFPSRVDPSFTSPGQNNPPLAHVTTRSVFQDRFIQRILLQRCHSLHNALKEEEQCAHASGIR